MDGILIVKKEKGYTSHDVVAKVKKLLKTKVGHTGTLDPMATGVLPLLLGEGTKLSKYLIEHDKIYEATVELGKSTDTLDAEGKVIEEKSVDESLLTKENIKQVLKSIEGIQIQKPPIYSAIKVKGKKLYEYARNNENVEIPQRQIEIYNIKLLEYSIKEKTITYRVHCSKGTYIRSLCQTIAEKLNTLAYLKELNRIKVGKFEISSAITIGEIEEYLTKEEHNIEYSSFLKKHVITIEKFFESMPEVILNDQKLNLFLNGVQLTANEINVVNFQSPIYRIYNKQNKFIGTGTIQSGLLKRDIKI